MFDHLDDDRPFVPDQAAVFATARRRARTRHRVIAATATMPVLLVAGALVYLRSQADELHRRAIGGLTPITAPIALPGDTSTPSTDTSLLTTPMNILVVGTDGSTTGTVTLPGGRADAIAIVRIDPVRHRLAVLSIPRDVWWSQRPGSDTRIGSMVVPDPSRLVNAVTALTGLEINHFISIDLTGLIHLVDLAGGVDLPLDSAVRDPHVGLDLPAGCQHLDGVQALGYLRSRHLNEYDPTTHVWREDPSADFGRIARQQDFMRRVVAKVFTHQYGLHDELTVITDVLDNITVDDGLDVDSLKALFDTARAIGTPPVSYSTDSAFKGATIANQSVLIPDVPTLRTLVAEFTNDDAGATGITDPRVLIAPSAGPC